MLAWWDIDVDEDDPIVRGRFRKRTDEQSSDISFDLLEWFTAAGLVEKARTYAALSFDCIRLSRCTMYCDKFAVARADVGFIFKHHCEASFDECSGDVDFVSRPESGRCV